MSFDVQAAIFEARAGLPAAACRDIALAVVELGAFEPGDLLVEIGPGTGQIGCELARLVPRYLGLDASPRMLEAFRSRLGTSPQAELVLGDAAARWPVTTGTVRCIFGSRSLHLLPARHVAAEAARVAGRGGSLLLLGRVTREPSCLREILRGKLRELVGKGRGSGRAYGDELLSECAARSATQLPACSVARWQVSHSVDEVLAGWSEKPDLAKAAVEPAERQRVLAELRAFAVAELGDPAARHASSEAYELLGVRFG